MGLFGRRKAAEAALSQAQAELAALRNQLTAMAGERDELQAERDLTRDERDELRATVKRQDDEIAAAEANATALTERVAEAEAEAAAVAAREAGRLAALAEDKPAASWPLVLADMERRWANTVGVPPGNRAMKATETAGQLAEALDREVERVREEVGVDVSLTVGGEVAAPDPVVFLLAATDLLGAMVSTCERVVLELGDGLVIVGEVWSELGDEIEVSRQRAVDAGLHVEPVDVGEDTVRVRLTP